MSLMSPEQRRARLVVRHRLEGGASTTLEATRSVVCLHATDPATVYLSVLARAHSLGLGDVSRELYDDRALVRMMAMRRTLFVVPREHTEIVHQAASLDVAATIRKRIVTDLGRLPTDPVLPADVSGWLAGVEAGVEKAAARLGVATGAQLGTAEPRLRTAILPSTDKKYDVRRYVTSQVLTLVAAEGRLVRGRPTGAWTSRTHTWEPGRVWWPEGLPSAPSLDAKAALLALYLARFGPATETDLAWWTGWALGVTRKALALLAVVEVDGGLVLADDLEPVPVPDPGVSLLPALDPTPMGWKQREWFLPPDSAPLYDRFGNVGPTVWWGGEVVGGWGVRADGSIGHRLLVDRGAEVARAVASAAEALQDRLAGAAVTPSFPTPLETELRRGA